jgi:hypothetical protein
MYRGPPPTPTKTCSTQRRTFRAGEHKRIWSGFNKALKMELRLTYDAPRQRHSAVGPLRFWRPEDQVAVRFDKCFSCYSPGLLSGSLFGQHRVELTANQQSKT